MQHRVPRHAQSESIDTVLSPGVQDVVQKRRQLEQVLNRRGNFRNQTMLPGMPNDAFYIVRQSQATVW